jgi:hypothetical protein
MKKKCNVVQIKYSGHPHSYSHLYITSDDKIEVGDYYVDKADSSIEFCKERVEAVLAFRFNYCKVIASTDPSLNLPAIREWFIKEYAEKQTSEVLVDYHTDNQAFHYTDIETGITSVGLSAVKQTWTRDEIESAMESVLSEYTCTLSFLKNELLKKLDSVEQD